MVEREPEELSVGGSIPSPGTIFLDHSLTNQRTLKKTELDIAKDPLYLSRKIVQKSTVHVVDVLKWFFCDMKDACI